MEGKDLLINAQNEIMELRRQNELLKAKVEVMDLFGSVLHAIPPSILQRQDFDIVYHIQQHLDKSSD